MNYLPAEHGTSSSLKAFRHMNSASSAVVVIPSTLLYNSRFPTITLWCPLTSKRNSPHLVMQMNASLPPLYGSGSILA